MEEKQKNIRVLSYGGGTENDGGSVSITGLSRKEVENLLAMVAGACFVGTKNNHLEVVSKFKDLPGPVDDPVMYPFWRKPKNEEIAQISLFDDFVFEEISEHSCPAIYISSICGYFYTEAKYKLYVERLESYGFECMRSKRGADAKFWEVWYLPGLWSAKGDLKNHLTQNSKDISVALKFIGGRVEFGSLSVSIQKLAQRIPE